eukprot:2624348-Prymnesium_polylepis.1
MHPRDNRAEAYAEAYAAHTMSSSGNREQPNVAQPSPMYIGGKRQVSVHILSSSSNLLGEGAETARNLEVSRNLQRAETSTSVRASAKYAQFEKAYRVGDGYDYEKPRVLPIEEMRQLVLSESQVRECCTAAREATAQLARRLHSLRGDRKSRQPFA